MSKRRSRGPSRPHRHWIRMQKKKGLREEAKIAFRDAEQSLETPCRYCGCDTLKEKGFCDENCQLSMELMMKDYFEDLSYSREDSFWRENEYLCGDDDDGTGQEDYQYEWA